MTDYSAINNKRHLDIAVAALSSITERRWLANSVAWLLRKWSNQCNQRIDPAWRDKRKGLISGDWR